MFGPAWHCLTQFDVQADSVLQMVLDLGRYLDNHPIPDHEDIVNIIKEIVGTIVTSVNGKTGEVNLKLSDVTGTDSWPVWILSNAEYGEITDATMLDAYDNDGFRLLYVQAGDDPEKEPAFLMIPGRTFNPDGITRYIFTGGGGSGGGAVQSVNGKIGTVVLTADDVGAATPADVTAVDNKVAAKYGPDNPPPYPVTSVNTKTGAVSLTASDVGAATNASVAAKYGPDNPPPYPVTGSVDSAGSASFFVKDSGNVGLVADGAGNVFGINTAGTRVKMYSPINPPPSSPITVLYANTSGSVTINNTDTAIPFTVSYSTSSITVSGVNFSIPAGTYGITVCTQGTLNTSESTQITLKTVNAGATVYHIQSYFSASPSNQFVLSWPLQIYHFPSGASLQFVMRIDSGGTIGTFTPTRVSIIKLA